MVQLSPGPRPQTPRPAGPDTTTAHVSSAHPGMEGPVDGLRRAIARPTPVLTWYRGADRVELSGRTLGTWVAKTVHLMAGEGIGSEDRVGLGLLATRPLHWVTLTWLMACWWSGATPVVRGPVGAGPVGEGPVGGAGTALEVSGPDPGDADPAVPLVQCSLAPLAGPCDRAVPGAIDFSEALAMPDQIPAPAPVSLSTPRLDGPTTLTELDLRGAAAVDHPLVLAGHPGPADLAATLAGCLAGAGSLILAEDPHGPLERLAAQEHATIAEQWPHSRGGMSSSAPS